MRFTADVPDDLVTDAAAAWARINDRRAADQRQELTIADEWAREVLIDHLGNILIADTHETENEATNAAVGAVQLRGGAVKRAAAPVDDPAGPVIP